MCFYLLWTEIAPTQEALKGLNKALLLPLQRGKGVGSPGDRPSRQGADGAPLITLIPFSVKAPLNAAHHVSAAAVLSWTWRSWRAPGRLYGRRQQR